MRHCVQGLRVCFGAGGSNALAHSDVPVPRRYIRLGNRPTGVPGDGIAPSVWAGALDWRFVEFPIALYTACNHNQDGTTSGRLMKANITYADISIIMGNASGGLLEAVHVDA